MLIVFALIIFLSLPKNIFALEGGMCKIYDKGNDKIYSTDIKNFENNLK